MNYQFDKHPIANRQLDKPVKEQLPIEAVDKLADELVAEYSNPAFRKWYCSIIYQYGTAQVLEWRQRASSGDNAGRLFSSYVTDAKKYNKASRELST